MKKTMTLTWTKFNEADRTTWPKDNETIIIAEHKSVGWDMESLFVEPKVVVYQWDVEIDGEYTGNSICFESLDDFNDDDHRLVVILDGGYYMEEGIFWMKYSDMYEAFDRMLENG